MKCVSFWSSAPAAYHHLPSQVQRRFQAHLVLAVALLLCLLFAGCDVLTQAPAPTTVPPAAPAATAPTGVLPSFSDWRLAYLGQDARVHVVTQDGKTDLTGPTLSAFAQESPWGQVVIAPDGRALAYPWDRRTTGHPGGVLNLRPGAPGPQAVQTFQGDTLSWSPDSTRLAYVTYTNSQGPKDWEILTLGNVTPSIIPNSQQLAPQGSLIGWIDPTHLAVSLANADPVTFYTLSSLDVMTGTLQKIATISANGLGNASFRVFPDGSEILLTNSGGEGIGDYTPITELINTQTGQKRRLPTITTRVAGGFQICSWKPGTEQGLVFYGDPNDSSIEFGGMLLDLAADTTTSFPQGIFPLGWAPDTSALFIGTQLASGTPTVPASYQVSTMGAPPPATASLPVFKISSLTFPFLGFVRTS